MCSVRYPREAQNHCLGFVGAHVSDPVTDALRGWSVLCVSAGVRQNGVVCVWKCDGSGIVQMCQYRKGTSPVMHIVFRTGGYVSLDSILWLFTVCLLAFLVGCSFVSLCE